MSSGCHHAPSTHYLAEITELQNRIDDFHGELSTTRDIPQRLQTLIEQDPSQPQAYAEAAHFIVFVGSPNGWPGRSNKPAQAAASLLDDAEQRDGNYCPTYWLRTQLSVALDQPDRALSAAATADAHHCDDPYLRVSRGRALMAKAEIEPDDLAKKDVASAEVALRSVFDAGPGATSHSRAAYAAAAYDFGRLLYGTGRHDELREHLARWEAAGQVFDPWSQVNIAYLYDLVGMFDRAEMAAQAALTVFNIPAARNSMGLALYGQAWTHELAGDAEANALNKRAQQYLTDESLAVKTFSGAACCVSDPWKALLEAHSKRNAISANTR